MESDFHPVTEKLAGSWQIAKSDASRKPIAMCERAIFAGLYRRRDTKRIEKLWDENALPEVRDESLAAATLEKHDLIIRRNLGMNETASG